MPSRRQTRRISARDFARDRGWRESAVVHRIRAGIYDGEEVDGEWYVLRDRPHARGHDRTRRHAPDLPRRPRRRLPWPTVPGPLAWAGWIVWSCIGVFGASFVLILTRDFTEHPAAMPWMSFLGVVLFLVLTIEGVQTGVIRTRFGLRTFAEMPVRFVFHLVLYGVLTLASAAVFLRMIDLALSPA